jgi:CMP-N-acetylneuraminic acid synthetase
MIKNKKVICLVVARKNSVGLKNKNILKVRGKPLIYWTFKSAKNSKYIDHIIFSTDSKQMIKIAKKNKIHVPFVRPKKLSKSNSSVYDVIKHSKKYFSRIDNFYYLILLQPTCPFRTSKHIDDALKKFATAPTKIQKTLISVSKASKKMNWLLKKTKKNFLQLVIQKNAKFSNRQDLNELYLPNGAIYICRLKNFKDNFYTNQMMYFLMNEMSSIDIDNKNDLDFARKNDKFLKRYDAS